jgi:hypothetical protein
MEYAKRALIYPSHKGNLANSGLKDHVGALKNLAI